MTRQTSPSIQRTRPCCSLTICIGASASNHVDKQHFSPFFLCMLRQTEKLNTQMAQTISPEQANIHLTPTPGQSRTPRRTSCRKTSVERDRYQGRPPTGYHHKTHHVLCFFIFLVQPVFGFMHIITRNNNNNKKRGLTSRLYWKTPLNALKRM